jgi:hypothetical protein
MFWTVSSIAETTERRRRLGPVSLDFRSDPMADDSTTTIRATFKTREAAEIAVERLVQQYGVPRPDIFIQPVSDRNTAGSAPSGGDASHDEGARRDAPLRGEIEVSADIAEGQIAAVRRSFEEAGAVTLSGH